MATIQCKTEIPAVEGLKPAELTVGRDFLLVCDGEFPRDLHQEQLQFVLKPEQKYVLKLRSFEFRSLTTADIKVTSYMAGKFELQDLQLSDGAQTLSLGPVSFAVETVIPPADPANPQAQPQPFGPFGPAQMAVPALYWAILFSVLGVFALVLIAKIYRVVQRRNMLERLKEHDSALSPLSEFHKGMRNLARVNTVFFGTKVEPEDVKLCLRQTDHMLRLYLTRKFRLPAFEWGDRLILKDIKKHNRKIFDHYADDLKKLLKELSRGLQDKDNVTGQDALNIATQSRTLVEKMESNK
ncbi:MAG: hypothetical protein HUU57_10405 [Bdellovibrio sp.]|nr:hypothetical protein [Bdellovibrio sp.]